MLPRSAVIPCGSDSDVGLRVVGFQGQGTVGGSAVWVALPALVSWQLVISAPLCMLILAADPHSVAEFTPPSVSTADDHPVLSLDC